MKIKTRTLVECAVMIACANVLSFIKLKLWALGGGVTLVSMLPLVIIARRHGTKVGLIAAFAHGVIQMLFGLDNVQYATGFFMAVGIIALDYIVAYGAIGLSGVNSERTTHASNGQIILGVCLSFMLRLLCHFISGWWIWEALWPNELAWAAPVWSLAYNASYMIPEIILTCIAACLLNKSTRLLDRV